MREDGARQVVDTVYLDIAPDARITFAYTITVDDKRLSASLVTVEFLAHGEGTHMYFTEQLAYFGGYDDREERKKGTQEGLDRLALMFTGAPQPH